MRLEDVNDQEMRDLRELVSKLTLDNKSLSSKITGQKEQSKYQHIQQWLSNLVIFIFGICTLYVIVSTVVSCERNHASFNSQDAYKTITYMYAELSSFYCSSRHPSIHV